MYILFYRMWHCILYHYKRLFVKIIDSKSAYSIINSFWKWKCDNNNEYFIVLSTDLLGYTHRVNIHSVGNEFNVWVNPKKLFQHLYFEPIFEYYVAHNHPSEEIQSSEEDRELTSFLRDKSKDFGLNLKHHLILTTNSFSIVS